MPRLLSVDLKGGGKSTAVVSPQSELVICFVRNGGSDAVDFRSVHRPTLLPETASRTPAPSDADATRMATE